MSEQGVWWLALDPRYTSYREAKTRRVLSQGWPLLGDLSSLAQLASDEDNRSTFEAAICSLVRSAYKANPNELRRAPSSLWRLFRVARGDLVVAVEGTVVRGLASVGASGWASYQFEGDSQFAQTVGHPTEWHDWSTERMGVAPNAPRRLLGVKAIRAESKRVFSAWRELQQRISKRD